MRDFVFGLVVGRQLACKPCLLCCGSLGGRSPDSPSPGRVVMWRTCVPSLRCSSPSLRDLECLCVHWCVVLSQTGQLHAPCSCRLGVCPCRCVPWPSACMDVCTPQDVVVCRPACHEEGGGFCLCEALRLWQHHPCITPCSGWFSSFSHRACADRRDAWLPGCSSCCSSVKRCRPHAACSMWCWLTVQPTPPVAGACAGFVGLLRVASGSFGIADMV